ncbi:Ig-like domain-containing protein [Fodinicurvata sp. EGI_FJ10296]|uniref:Ig-like domain-containing protein n=1 Tax=Fodinicurvata sp. EGI_FJ10296 TaxID=3231908 RepID=UPI00345353E5
MTHPAAARRRTILVTATMLLLPGVVLAQDRFCDPVPIPEIAGCSPAAMLDALNGDQIITGPRSPQVVFAEGQTRPGQGYLDISGLVGEFGSVCAQPVSALTTDGLIMSGALRDISPRDLLGDGDVTGGIGTVMEFMSRMSAGEAPSGNMDADMLNVLIPPDSDMRDVVFELSSPNAFTLESGVLGNPIWIEHSGATGWSPRSASHFVVQLPDTTPADLQPGEVYRAIATAPRDGDGASGAMPTLAAFYTTWDGRFRRFSQPDQAAPPMAVPFLRDIQRNLELPDGIGGLDIAQMAISGEGQAFAGEITMVGGRLNGTVTIDEITDTTVYGRLELSGDAWAETDTREFTYDDEGQLDGSRRVDISQQDASLTVYGGFAAPNQGSMTHIGHSAVAIDGRGGDRPPVLGVEANFPASGAKNLDFDDPRLEVVFDRAIDPASIGPGTAYLEYRSASGGMARVDVTADVDDDTLHFHPVDALPPGAWYRLIVEGGQTGPAGRDGAVLPGPFGLTFATVPDEFEITPVVIQVARDAPLVAGKTTLTRLYIDWERPEGTVHESWHVRDIPANAWVTDEREGQLYETKEDVPVPNEDLATPDQQRVANNTVNFFGWDPMLRETREVLGFIEPLDPCDQPLGEEDGKTGVTWTDLQRDLTFDYYMMRVGPWADGISPAARGALRSVAHNAARFTQQTFPVTGVSGRFAGDYTPTRDWQERYGDNLPDSYSGDAELMLMSELHDAVAQFSNADMIVAFLPTEVSQGGSSYGPVPLADGGNEFRWSQPVRFRTPTVAMQGVARGAMVPAITHEFGHGFGLRHVPDVANVGERQAECDSGRTEMAGIEGFRLSLDGSGGNNKSFEEGNGETTWGLLPLMYPCAEEYSKHFILRDYYLQLIDGIRTHAAAETPENTGPSYAQSLQSILVGGPAQAADGWSDGGPQQFVVVGTLGETTATASIDRMAPALRRFRDTGPEGDFTLIARDRSGSILAQRPLGADMTGENGSPFFSVISTSRPPFSLEIRHGEKTVAQRRRSLSPPQIHGFRLADSGGDIARLRWEAEDSDDDPLRYTVLFRSAEDDGWRVVAVAGDGATAAVHRAALPAGPDPTFRLIASDGMDQATADISAAAAARPPELLPEADTAEDGSDAAGEADFVPDPGPPRLGGGLAETDPTSEADAADDTRETGNVDAPEPRSGSAAGGSNLGTIAFGGESHEFALRACTRTTVGPDTRLIDISGATAPEGQTRLVVSATIADLPGGGNQVVEARRVDAGGDEIAVYVAMRTNQGGEWVTGLGDPANGPLLTVDGTTISGSGEFLDRTGMPESLGTGRFEAHCQSFSDG